MNIKIIFLILGLSSFGAFAEVAPVEGDRQSTQTQENSLIHPDCIRENNREEGESAAQCTVRYEEQVANNSVRNAARSGMDPRSAECHAKLILARKTLAIAGTNPAMQPEIGRINASFLPGGDLFECRQLELTAKANRAGLNYPKEMTPTTDRKITCTSTAGFTVDYKSCQGTARLYDQVVVADAIMNEFHKFQANNNTKKMGEEVAMRSAQGDAQNAALDATIAQNKSLAGMHQQKAAAYVAAVGALAAKLKSWQTKNDGDLAKLCQGIPLGTGLGMNLPSNYPCEKAVVDTKEQRGVFANEGAKGQFILALADYVRKAAEAGIAASQLSKIAKQVNDMKQGTEELPPTLFEKCAVTPMDPACQNTVLTPGTSFQPGDFSIGDGIGSNVIGNNGLTDSTITEDPSLSGPTDSVADISNPFEEDAKVASGIIDEAGAASVQPTGGAGSGAGGGGASGGMGGGSASLGNDLAGADADADKNKDIKANKLSGNYASSGGKGFTAVKGMKEDANPFASLFDSKAQGGVEEDRSIASEGGQDSGLFRRISKKYEQIQADKRIESTNLE